MFTALVVIGVFAQIFAGACAIAASAAAGHAIDGTKFDHPIAAVITFLVVFFLWPVLLGLFLAFVIIATPIGLVVELIKYFRKSR